MSDVIKTDICIVGGGSGGFGSAISALRESQGNLKVLLIDENSQLGGNSTVGGVNAWEPGIGGPGIHKEIFSMLSKNPINAGFGRYTKFGPKDRFWGMVEQDNTVSYEDTLRRKRGGRFIFEPYAMSEVMRNMLLNSEKEAEIMLNTVFIESHVMGQRIQSIKVYNKEEDKFYIIEAKMFIDCTADIELARKSGCETAFGEDEKAKYMEPSAPDLAKPVVNGITQIFRVTPTNERRVDELPKWVHETDAFEWANAQRPTLVLNVYPNGDINLNTLPTMEGETYFKLSPKERNKQIVARTYAIWHIYQTELGFDNYSLKYFAPRLGIRESYRLIGQYVLKETDIKAGFMKQAKNSEIIAFGDHAIDNHSTEKKTKKLEELNLPYGIPYSSLVPKEIENLAVACRGASFSHIAAGSCRLSRTMMALGEAAGTAAVLAINGNLMNFAGIDTSKLRHKLGIDTFEENILR